MQDLFFGKGYNSTDTRLSALELPWEAAHDNPLSQKLIDISAQAFGMNYIIRE